MALILDLFCGAGGASAGYMEAGHRVVGVDLNPARGKRYIGERFVAADALAVLRNEHPEINIDAFDFIHASPPCQVFTRAGHLREAQGKTTSKLDLVDPVRRLLDAVGLPYVIENVEGAPLRNPVTLCGSMFGLKVRRHRLFEAGGGLDLDETPACRHREQGRPVGVYGSMRDEIPSGGRTARSIEEAREAMGIGWMIWPELVEAIPPAYTRWIGQQIDGNGGPCICDRCTDGCRSKAGESECRECGRGGLWCHPS